jgi:hypothetical protein
MQSGLTAGAAFGYYSAQEFEFAPYVCIRPQVLELGRASIDRGHRSSEVLTLLWRGIAQYAKYHGLRYLIGCSSLNSKDPLEGWGLYRQLVSQLVSFEYVTVPTAAFSLPRAEAESVVRSSCQSCSEPISAWELASVGRRRGTAPSAPSISSPF